MDTIQFEAVKVAIKQDKSGYVLTLCIHPDEIPEALMRDFVGARYQTVMVRIGEDEQPYKRPQADNSAKKELTVSNRAALLCKDQMFQKFLVESGLAWDMSEKAAAASIKETCAIDSRSQLDTDAEAKTTFEDIVKEYKEWKSTNV